MVGQDSTTAAAHTPPAWDERETGEEHRAVRDGQKRAPTGEGEEGDVEKQERRGYILCSAANLPRAINTPTAHVNSQTNRSDGG